MNTETEELMITSVVLTLFMLSLITEKITNFIKLHVPSLFSKFEDESSKKKREQKIQLVSAFVGILVALLCNADFFLLVRQGGTIVPLTELSLKGTIGCIITGLFLSQGSAFFHDLLDTLLYYKNMKKALYSKQEMENSLSASESHMNADEWIKALTGNNRHDQEIENF